MMMSATNEKICADYSRLLASLPWNVTLPIVAAIDRNVDIQVGEHFFSVRISFCRLSILFRGVTLPRKS